MRQKKEDLDSLQKLVAAVRSDALKMVHNAQSGHVAGPLDLAETFVALYFSLAKHNPKKPEMKERDRIILSCGHVCPSLYATLAHAGYFPRTELMTLRKLQGKKHTRLEGHPHNLSLPGIETSSGPLGQGTSQAVGMALSFKIDKKKNRVWCVTSDGEHNEGQVWEAIMLAAKYKLDNLTFFIDRNNIQIDGFTNDVMPMDDIGQKYIEFNWHVLQVDGHNIKQIIDAGKKAQQLKGKPTVIICHTIPGKGVSFMEKTYKWHGKAPNDEELEKALQELQQGVMQ